MRIPKHAYGLAFLLVLGAAGSSVPALAQGSSTYPACPAGKTISAEDSEAAHLKYRSGRLDYDEGKYPSAIANFKDAYAKDCTKHEVLIIISRAYELNGDKRAALEALETFLARVPANYPERSTHEAKRDTLKQQVASLPSATATSTATPPPTATTTAQPPPPSGNGETRGHTAYPWIVVGVGAALVIAGTLVVATAPKLPANCDKDTEKCAVPQGAVPCTGNNTPAGCYDLQSDQNKAGTAKNQPPIGYGIIAGGALAVVGGLVWFFLEPTGSKESAKTKVVPELGKGFSGLSLTTSF